MKHRVLFSFLLIFTVLFGFAQQGAATIPVGNAQTSLPADSLLVNDSLARVSPLDSLDSAFKYTEIIRFKER